jgi:lipopolysaccharide transport system ATP-binding protein
LSASILGVPRSHIDAHLADIEAFAEIGDFIRKPLRTYSSGMRVRLAFALLTQVRPDLMIIDEALSVGDAYFAHKCARLIRQFRDEGRSLLFVSHDPGAVKTYCDHAVLLDKGILIRSGQPADTLDYYNAMIAAKERELEIRVSEGAPGRRQTQSGTQEAVLGRFDVLGENGKSVRAVPCGATVRIVCEINFRSPVSAPTVGFMIRDRLGSEVFGTSTFYLGLKTRTYAAGECMEVAFTTRLNLGPGNYSCTIAVHAGADHREGNYDWRDNLIALSVIPNWPFQFAGIAALEASAKVSDEVTLLSRNLALGEAIDFTKDGNSQLYAVNGWSMPEDAHCWTEGKKATVAALIAQKGDLVMTAEVIPFTYPGAAEQRVFVACMETPICEWSLREPAVVKVRIPAAVRPREGELRITFELPGARSPSDAGVSGDLREIAVGFRRITFTNAASL